MISRSGFIASLLSFLPFAKATAKANPDSSTLNLREFLGDGGMFRLHTVSAPNGPGFHDWAEVPDQVSLSLYNEKLGRCVTVIVPVEQKNVTWQQMETDSGGTANQSNWAYIHGLSTR